MIKKNRKNKLAVSIITVILGMIIVFCGQFWNCQFCFVVATVYCCKAFGCDIKRKSSSYCIVNTCCTYF